MTEFVIIISKSFFLIVYFDTVGSCKTMSSLTTVSLSTFEGLRPDNLGFAFGKLCVAFFYMQVN